MVFLRSSRPRSEWIQLWLTTKALPPPFSSTSLAMASKPSRIRFSRLPMVQPNLLYLLGRCHWPSLPRSRSYSLLHLARAARHRERAPTVGSIKATKTPLADPFVKAIRNLVFQAQFIKNDPHGLNGTA